jgi:ABC-type branched-subunit amino acid transport system ATPase component
VDYGGVRALDAVSLDARAGEITAIVGSNGAGKTTLFDALAGTVAAVGTVVLDGDRIDRLEPDARARRGLVRSFQTARLFPTLTVRETIAVSLERTLGRMRPWRREERRIARRVAELVDAFGLEHEVERRVGELSTATRRIVDLACAAASRPAALLLDEPSAGLAAAETTMLAPLLRRLVRETGCAMLLIEHDAEVVRRSADRVVTMELGRIVG